MGQPKRKHIFLISYENEFRGITRSKKGEEYAHCVPCNSDICLTATGKTAITIHFDSAKHKNAKKRNLLLPETVKYLLLIKVNFDETCEEMYDFLTSKPKLLEKIGSTEKYGRNEV